MRLFSRLPTLGDVCKSDLMSNTCGLSDTLPIRRIFRILSNRQSHSKIGYVKLGYFHIVTVGVPPSIAPSTCRCLVILLRANLPEYTLAHIFPANPRSSYNPSNKTPNLPLIADQLWICLPPVFFNCR